MATADHIFLPDWQLLFQAAWQSCPSITVSQLLMSVELAATSSSFHRVVRWYVSSLSHGCAYPLDDAREHGCCSLSATGELLKAGTAMGKRHRQLLTVDLAAEASTSHVNLLVFLCWRGLRYPPFWQVGTTTPHL